MIYVIPLMDQIISPLYNRRIITPMLVDCDFESIKHGKAAYPDETQTIQSKLLPRAIQG